jgi:hypothetical protein
MENMEWCFLGVVSHKELKRVFFDGDGMIDVFE